jgi:hypothetical protein
MIKFLPLLLLLLPLLSHAQQDLDSLPETTYVGRVHKAELYYTVKGNDTLYKLRYIPQEHLGGRFYKTIEFLSIDNTLQKLYALLKTFFTADHRNKKKYMLSFDLGNSHVTAYNYPAAGGNQVRLWTNQGEVYLDERQIDKLFGK